MDILNEFKRSEKEFINWFCNYYKHHINVFEKSPFNRQCEVIWRFLGYPVIETNDWSITNLEEQTRKYLYIYEDIMTKYPGGVPDILGNLNRMSHVDRMIKYPKMDEPANILHSINEAIVDREKYGMTYVHILSLSDAIKMLRNAILAPKPVEDKFWECILPNNRKNEDVPF